MSQQYIAAFVSLLVVVLPLLGVHVGSEQLTQTIQTIVVIISGVWVMVRRYKQGDINILGARK